MVVKLTLKITATICEARISTDLYACGGFPGPHLDSRIHLSHGFKNVHDSLCRREDLVREAFESRRGIDHWIPVSAEASLSCAPSMLTSIDTAYNALHPL